jgi:hypothetical protein
VNVKHRIYDHWTMQVLRTSTTEERGGCVRMNSAERREKNSRTECRGCQQNTWKRGGTVRLFGTNSLKKGAV